MHKLRRKNLRFIEAPAEPAGAGAPATAEPAPADKPLGPNGEKALQAEREARKTLEQTVAQMQQAQKDQMAAIASAFGVKSDPKDADGSQLLTALQQQVADMQREALVFRVAAAHQLTESDDIEFLKSAKDEDAMGRLAGRLAAQAASTPGTPKPDLTQGGKGDAPKPEPQPGVARMAAAFDEDLSSK